MSFGEVQGTKSWKGVVLNKIPAVAVVKVSEAESTKIPEGGSGSEKLECEASAPMSPPSYEDYIRDIPVYPRLDSDVMEEYVPLAGEGVIPPFTDVRVPYVKQPTGSSALSSAAVNPVVSSGSGQVNITLNVNGGSAGRGRSRSVRNVLRVQSESREVDNFQCSEEFRSMEEDSREDVTSVSRDAVPEGNYTSPRSNVEEKEKKSVENVDSNVRNLSVAVCSGGEQYTPIRRLIDASGVRSPSPVRVRSSERGGGVRMSRTSTPFSGSRFTSPVLCGGVKKPSPVVQVELTILFF